MARRIRSAGGAWIDSRLEIDGHIIKPAEDPRFVEHCGKLYCTYNKNVGNSGNKTCITSVEKTPETYAVLYGNRVEKNWCFFSLGGRLYAVYDLAISRVLEFSNFQVAGEMDSEPLTWEFGRISGSTPPVMVGDRLTMFFHSWVRERWGDASNANRPIRVYYIGYCELESSPPFAVLRYSKRPLAVFDFNQWPCVYPCSALRYNNGWQLACGFNDYCSGRVFVSDRVIENSMQGCKASVGV